MPPKGSKSKSTKATKAAPAPKRESSPEQLPSPALDEIEISDADHDEIETVDTKPKAKTTKSPRKARVASKTIETKYTVLPSVFGDTVPITVDYVGDSPQAAAAQNGMFEIVVKLSALQTFRLDTSIVMDSTSHYSGKTALVMETSKPFPLMRLSKETRSRIWKYVLAPQGSLDGKIAISHMTGGRSGATAKAYTEGKKHRVSILMVNKEILAETRPLLYSFHFKFDDTSVLLNFLTVTTPTVRALLKSIEILTYKRIFSTPAFFMLCDCTTLTRLHIATAVGTNSTPSKAAKAFHQDAGRFLEAMAALRGGRAGAINVMRFGKTMKCFSVKNEDGELRAWTDEEKQEFQDQLMAKLT